VNEADHCLGAAPLTAAIEALVAAGGSTPEEAALVARNLVGANLAGHDSHGIGMIPRYVESLLEGGLRINRAPIVRLDSGSMLVLDGDWGYGQAIGQRAMQMAIERAKRHGSCILGLSNTHHIGRIGHWAEQAIAEGLVSIHFVNVLTRPIVAPWGGRDARLGTNPFCVGIPFPPEAPVLLDMATSGIAQGKARVAFNRGEPLEAGLMIDSAGEPTTDPRFAVVPPYGALLPVGEHKGSGIALVCELLGGALAGGATWHQPHQGQKQVLNGMLAILVDPQALGTADNLREQAMAFIDWVRQSPPGSGIDHLRLAGDAEREQRAHRLAHGVPVDANTWRDILAAAGKLGLDPQSIDRIARAA
jgi:uncharacterized oxidoreductase